MSHLDWTGHGSSRGSQRCRHSWPRWQLGSVRMDRLCERPGCSEPASVAYGMKAEDLVFWLDVLRDAYSPECGVLCQRHADSMVVPRGWTLDDLRDPDLHLFRPPAAQVAERSRSTRSRTSTDPATEQLEFNVGGGDELVGDVHVVSAEGSPESAVESSEPLPEPSPDPWTPTFDDDDDLDGLLTARSPLLARAFRGADRPANS